MAGNSLDTAKRAALAILDRLDPRDYAAIVIFDDRIDVLQPLTPVTPEFRHAVRGMLAQVEARGSTALYEGWLAGCMAVAPDAVMTSSEALARAFLLTDGHANVGLSDPSLLASRVAEVRERTGIGTSTFGVGAGYNETLLGQMAVAGGGQFHNLRTSADIASTFLGEVGELLTVAVARVRLELELEPDMSMDVVSAYWTSADAKAGFSSIALGDLLAGEERQVVVRFAFPPAPGRATRRVRARLVWQAGGQTQVGEWRQVDFSYADHTACDLERRDPVAMHWVGLHHAERAKLRSAEQATRGEISEARATLRGVASRIAEYAGSDSDLQAVIRELASLEAMIVERRLNTMASKELHFESLRRGRGQRDFRQ